MLTFACSQVTDDKSSCGGKDCKEMYKCGCNSKWYVETTKIFKCCTYLRVKSFQFTNCKFSFIKISNFLNFLSDNTEFWDFLLYQSKRVFLWNICTLDFQILEHINLVIILYPVLNFHPFYSSCMYVFLHDWGALTPKYEYKDALNVITQGDDTKEVYCKKKALFSHSLHDQVGS